MIHPPVSRWFSLLSREKTPIFRQKNSKISPVKKKVANLFFIHLNESISRKKWTAPVKNVEFTFCQFCSSLNVLMPFPLVAKLSYYVAMTHVCTSSVESKFTERSCDIGNVKRGKFLLEHKILIAKCSDFVQNLTKNDFF